MMEAQDNVTYDQMKGAVGSLLFLWSDIERALSVGIQKLSSSEPVKPVHGIARSLGVWSQLVTGAGEGWQLQLELCQRLVAFLNEALDVRNLVCHGLVGISINNVPDAREPHLIVELGETRRILTWAELQEMFALMSRASWYIANLTAAAMEKEPTFAIKKLPSLEYFPG